MALGAMGRWARSRCAADHGAPRGRGRGWRRSGPARLEETVEALPVIAGDGFVDGGELAPEIFGVGAVAFGDRTHGEQRGRAEAAAGGIGDFVKHVDGHAGILVEAEDILHCGDAGAELDGGASVDAGPHEFEGVAQLLGVDPEGVVELGRGFAADAVAGLAYGPVALFDEVVGDSKDGDAAGRERPPIPKRARGAPGFGGVKLSAWGERPVGRREADRRGVGTTRAHHDQASPWSSPEQRFCQGEFTVR